MKFHHAPGMSSARKKSHVPTTNEPAIGSSSRRGTIMQRAAGEPRFYATRACVCAARVRGGRTRERGAEYGRMNNQRWKRTREKAREETPHAIVHNVVIIVTLRAEERHQQRPSVAKRGIESMEMMSTFTAHQRRIFNQTTTSFKGITEDQRERETEREKGACAWNVWRNCFERC